MTSAQASSQFSIIGSIDLGALYFLRIVSGRFMIGSTSGLRAVGNGFIANYSPPEQRTENLAVAQVLERYTLVFLTWQAPIA